ncbi:fructose-bisphosphatase class III, partial [Lactobacillus salivarius]|nr:fructose-bisphosphatase class III [Ligilactobacillus salivarius]
MNFDDNEELVNKQVDMNAYSHNLLKEKYPTKQDVITEIMNLEAILHLPKGTEHFVS